MLDYLKTLLDSEMPDAVKIAFARDAVAALVDHADRPVTAETVATDLHRLRDDAGAAGADTLKVILTVVLLAAEEGPETFAALARTLGDFAATRVHELRLVEASRN